MSTLRTLVMGYGNLDRSDDGVAYYVVNALRGRLGQPALAEDGSGLETRGGNTDAIFLTQLAAIPVSCVTVQISASSSGFVAVCSPLLVAHRCGTTTSCAARLRGQDSLHQI